MRNVAGSVPSSRTPYTVVVDSPGSSVRSYSTRWLLYAVQLSFSKSGWKPTFSIGNDSGMVSVSRTFVGSVAVDSSTNFTAGTGNSSASNDFVTVTGPSVTVSDLSRSGSELMKLHSATSHIK